jgi:hypothetical protein
MLARIEVDQHLTLEWDKRAVTNIEDIVCGFEDLARRLAATTFGDAFELWPIAVQAKKILRRPAFI